MASVESATEAAEYPELFVAYVARGVGAAQATLEPVPVTLSEEARDRILHILSFALQVAGAWPQTKTLLLQSAPFMEKAGLRDEWLPYLNEGLACSQRYNDNLTTAEIQWHIGHLQRLLSQFTSARENLNASAAAFATAVHPKGQARAWNELGYMAWHQQQHGEAQSYAESALACLSGDDPERAVSLSVLGLVAISWRHWQEGEVYFKEALQIRTTEKNQQYMAWNMQHLGYILHSKGDYDAAIPFYESAIHILTEVQDLRNCGIAQMSLGIVYSLMKQPTKALSLYADAESLFRKTHDFLHLAKIGCNQGIDYLALSQWHHAIQVFTNSARLYEQMQDTYAHANALDGLGLAYLGLGVYDKASAIFERVLEQLPLIQSHPMYAKMMKDVTIHLQKAQNPKVGSQ